MFDIVHTFLTLKSENSSSENDENKRFFLRKRMFTKQITTNINQQDLFVGNTTLGIFSFAVFVNDAKIKLTGKNF
jgi:hypothetical protein